MKTMGITAKDIAELRARTGAGMMDCKGALEEAGGDMAKAVDILRAKGIAKAEKRSGRSTAQGAIWADAAGDGSRATMLSLACETDFVARTDDFSALGAQLLARAGALGSADLASFLAAPASDGESQTVGDVVKAASGKTGEAVSVGNVASFAPGNGVVGSYLHFNRQVGVLVEVTGPGAATDAGRAVAKDIALHIASADPLAVRAEDVPADVVDRERRIAEEQVAAEGKPEAIRGKIVEGKVKKFLSERVLLDQPFVKDDKVSIGALVAAAAQTAGGEITVSRFIRMKVGEA